jgi:hypothetical protein
MNNQFCGCQSQDGRACCQNRPHMQCGCSNRPQMQCGCQNQSQMQFGCGCQSINGCPRPQPVVAPKRVCVTQQVTPVPQPVICPIECRRVNRCMYYPVFYPQYEQTFMTIPCNQSF